jgi:hypothetical protein
MSGGSMFGAFKLILFSIVFVISSLLITFGVLVVLASHSLIGAILIILGIGFVLASFYYWFLKRR